MSSCSHTPLARTMCSGLLPALLQSSCSRTNSSLPPELALNCLHLQAHHSSAHMYIPRRAARLTPSDGPKCHADRNSGSAAQVQPCFLRTAMPHLKAARSECLASREKRRLSCDDHAVELSAVSCGCEVKVPLTATFVPPSQKRLFVCLWQSLCVASPSKKVKVSVVDGAINSVKFACMTNLTCLAFRSQQKSLPVLEAGDPSSRTLQHNA